MRHIAILALLASLAFASVASAQQEMPSPDSLAKLMALYQELALPGPEHDLLKNISGRWIMETTMWPEPGSPPITSTLKGESSMILGGRFLQLNARGVIFGIDSESMSILGFDRRHKKFTLLSFDTQGTYYIAAAGTYDEKTSTLTLTGEDVDPIFKMVQKYDTVIKFTDKDTFTWSIVFKNPEMTRGADEFKMLEIVSKRVK